MKAFTLLLVCALGIAVWYKDAPRRREAAATKAAAAAAEQAMIASGWLVVPMPNGAAPNRVLIVAAPNCPRQESQRAVALANQLSARQIPCTQTGGVEFRLTSEQDANRLNTVMNAGAPVVFVNGKAKSNPSLEEVVAEYRAIGR